MSTNSVLQLLHLGGTFLAAAILAGCTLGERTINASSEESLRLSIAAIVETLAPDESAAFEAALRVVVMKDVADAYQNMGMFGALATAKQLEPHTMLATVHQTLEGKTAQEAIEIAQRISADRKMRQIESLDMRIANIEDAVRERETELSKKQAVLDQIAVTNQIYRWHHNSIRSEPVIDFNIRNGTDHPISRIYIHGILRSEGRSIPWVDASFNYEFPGGLEPGESQDLALTPGRFGEWAQRDLDGRDDLEFTLKVIDMAGTDKKMLVGWWDEHDRNKQQLAALRSEREALLTQ